MERHGKTAAGTERYRCPKCRKTTVIHRTDTRKRHLRDHFVDWLTGTDSKQKIAEKLGVSRQALSKEFQQFFGVGLEPPIPTELTARILIVDGTYIEGRALCALVAVTERDRIFWRFATEERYGTWLAFLESFPPPKVVVADGQKGMQRFVKHHWPQTAFQRCHFHLVMLVTHYLTRNPSEEVGRDILDLVHRLKYVKAPAERDRWLLLHRIWEKRYEKVFAERTAGGVYAHRKLRSVRSVLRRATPQLFTYLDYPGCPNTTNLVEGWVNTAIAEGIGRHRGLTLEKKKTLVSVILSNLKRPTREKPTRKFP
ncbi:MAG: transposase [bacterium]|nr:transposase [bacterium]